MKDHQKELPAAPTDTGGGDGPKPVQATAQATAVEQRLVMRCLAGEEQAWEQIYRRCHPQLLEAIRFVLGGNGKDGHLVEEIAARVWYALVRNRARLLARYDAERDSSLSAFLMGLARIEMMRQRRSERRRKSHELTGGRRMLEEQGASDWEVFAMMDEFASTLTDREKEFLDDYLTSSSQNEDGEDSAQLSATNIWQRRHRIRSKLEAFLDDVP